MCRRENECVFDEKLGVCVCHYCGTFQPIQSRENSDCEYCRSKNSIITDENNSVCMVCGIIKKETINDGPDWSNYEADKENGVDNSRVGWQDFSNPYSTLTTHIKKGKNTWFKSTDKEGKIVNCNLIRLHQITSSSHKEKAFYEIIKQFDDLVHRGYVCNRIVSTAKLYWNEIVKSKKIVRGGNRQGILSCCLLYSSFSNQCPKTREQIAEYMMISKDEIIKGEPIFKDVMASTKYKDILEKKLITKEMFPQFVYKLKLKYNYITKFFDLYLKCEEELSEISSAAAIAGIISFVVNVQEKNKTPTKKQIIEAVGITNPTLTNALKIINTKITPT